MREDRSNRLHQAVALRLEGRGEKEIAQELSVRQETISNYLTSTEGQALLEDARNNALATARDRMSQHTDSAVIKLSQIMECGIPGEERRAAVEILKLGGIEKLTRPLANLDFSTAVGIQNSLEETARAALAGSVSLDGARTLATLAGQAARILELEELEKRLTRLEAHLESICHADEIVAVGGA